jgi:hypothetical protein
LRKVASPNVGLEWREETVYAVFPVENFLKEI